MEHTTPMVIVITHFINLFAIILLIRSGLHILADHPMLYWTEHTRRDNHWLKFGKKKMPNDRLWTSLDEAITPMPGALPGGWHNLGMGRNWHFLTALSWVLNGLIYIVLLFATGMWKTLIPTSFSIFPQAWQTLIRELN